MIEEFFIKNFFLISKLIYFLGVILLIYGTSKKGKRSNLINNDTQKRENIVSNKEKKRKNYTSGTNTRSSATMIIGVSLLVVGVIMSIVGIICIVMFISMIIYIFTYIGSFF